MKLLFCSRCHDIVKLQIELRHCRCKKSFGRYLEDGWHAHVGGKAMVIGIHNHSFAKAVQHMMQLPPDVTEKFYMSLNHFEAWVFHPRFAPRVEFLTE